MRFPLPRRRSTPIGQTIAALNDLERRMASKKRNNGSRNNGNRNRNNGNRPVNTPLLLSNLPSAPTTPVVLKTPTHPAKFTNKQILIWEKLPEHPLRTHHARLLGGNEVNSPFREYTYAQLRNSNVFKRITIAQLRELGNRMYYPRYGTRSNVNNVLSEVTLRRARPVPRNNSQNIELKMRLAALRT